MRVLVYGEWKNQSRNVVPFFTATYSESEIDPSEDEALNERRKSTPEFGLLFVGALSAGKRPMLAVQTAHRLLQKGFRVRLDIYGEGNERLALERYIAEHDLGDTVRLHGNQDAETVKEAYKRAHFLLFASRSEGWPKVVAEAMFWGCLPVTTAVSCVPYMVGEGMRGALVSPQVDAMAEAVEKYINDPQLCMAHRKEAMHWSRQFTLESFQKAIGRLL
jgi:glycosyltransferase involved in cell wall biosynthesis